WAIVLASLRGGAAADTEVVLTEAERSGADDAVGLPMFEAAVRAELRLAAGDVDAGLSAWRAAASAVGQTNRRGARAGPLEVRAVCVAAHAQHGRIDLVADIVAQLPGRLSALAGDLRPARFPVCGALLVALGLVTCARADGAVLGARMIALAHRMRYVHGFE